MDGSVVAKLFEKNIHLQSFKLRLAQKGVVFLRIIKIQKLFGQIFIQTSDVPPVLEIKISERSEESKS